MALCGFPPGRSMAGAVLVLLLTACSPISVNLVLPTPAAEQPATSGDTIAVVPLEAADLSAAELAQVLQIARWKFDVQVPANEMIHYQIMFHQPGQDDQILASFVLQSPEAGRERLMVAIRPVKGALLAADQISIFIGVGGSSTTTVVNNPAGSYTLLSPLTPAQPVEAEDDQRRFTLMEFSETGTPIPSAQNARLVLSVRPGEPETP